MEENQNKPDKKPGYFRNLITKSTILEKETSDAIKSSDKTAGNAVVTGGRAVENKTRGIVTIVTNKVLNKENYEDSRANRENDGKPNSEILGKFTKSENQNKKNPKEEVTRF